ncbi:hypothetical protein ACFP2T_03590 [Plantactinospora solaniradicis]|uniref:YncE family protein n=1 Tax=Plantactinospora solaniradicis TaxID=1723736 RepID=A0ABW1K460_9ACTN
MTRQPGVRGTAVLSAVVAVLVAGSLGSCVRFGAASASDCSEDGRIEMPAGRDSPGSPPAGQPAPVPVPEALWVADGSGTLSAVDGRTNQVTARVGIGRSIGPPILAVGGGLVWAYQNDGRIDLVDPVRARVTASAVVVPARPLADNRLYHGHGSLWIAQPGRLWRVSPAGKISAIPLPADFKPTMLAATGHWLWLAGGRRLVRVDPTTGATSIVDDLPGDTGIGQLLGTRDSLLAVGWNQPEIWVLDPDTAAPRSSIPLSDSELVSGMYDVGGEVWATGNCGNVVRVGEVAEPQLHKVRVSDVSQDFPAAVAAGSFWVADQVRSEVVRIDLRTTEVLARLPVEAADPDDPAFAVVAGRHSVWLLDGDVAGTRILRVDPETNRVLRLPSSVGASPADASFGVSVVVAAPPTAIARE